MTSQPHDTSVAADTELPPSNWLSAPGALFRGVAQLARRALVRRDSIDAAALKAALVPFVHHLPAPLREPLQRYWRARSPLEAAPLQAEPIATADIDSPVEIVATHDAPDASDEASIEAAYLDRIAQETAIFADQVDVHALPEIFHYWSNRYLLPMEQQFGARHPEDFLALHLFEAARRTGAARPRFVSLGCGNCDAEVRIAQDLVQRGLRDFTLECIDINPAMLERGRVLAREAGLEGRVVPVQGDFNRWNPLASYDGVMANQSLHHVLELENLFDAVAAALAPQGKFVVSDMIGRNGHQRWPEALQLVREFWRELPEPYRYNLQLQRQEPEFLDWDCSVEGFEGVRAQDILPLLLQRFGFEVFLPFGNLIDPFIDRGFGHHFDPQRQWDRDFIDRVHARDEAELRAGNITPTHMLAVLSNDRGASCHYRDNLCPAFCVRDPAR